MLAKIKGKINSTPEITMTIWHHDNVSNISKGSRFSHVFSTPRHSKVFFWRDFTSWHVNARRGFGKEFSDSESRRNLLWFVFVHCPIEMTEVWEIYPTNGHGHQLQISSECHHSRVLRGQDPQKRILTKTLTPHHLEKLNENFFKKPCQRNLMRLVSLSNIAMSRYHYHCAVFQSVGIIHAIRALKYEQ